MKRSIVLSAIIFSLCSMASAKVVKGYESASADSSKLTFQVDSIDFRSDLTRMYGRLIGIPHTSNRVDEISLTDANTAVTANDIDGVDFRRYFQWEDDGAIAIEIDFPAMKPTYNAQILFMTAHGPSTTTVKKNLSHRK